MRALLILAILIGALWAFDAYEFGGYYRRAAWNEANDQAANFNRDINDWLSKLGR